MAGRSTKLNWDGNLQNVFWMERKTPMGGRSRFNPRADERRHNGHGNARCGLAVYKVSAEELDKLSHLAGALKVPVSV